MTRLPPSFLGTVIATILSTVWVILDSQHFHLWTTPVRIVNMGGAFLVLLTYSLSWFLLEMEDAGELARGDNLVDYLMRLAAQTVLGVALASIGIDFGIYIWLFAAFISLSFVWSMLSFKSRKAVIGHEFANLAFCGFYTFLVFQLYLKAVDFDKSYPSMVQDKAMYNVRVTSLRGESSDSQMYLAFVVGAILINLIWMLTKAPWPKSASRQEAVSESPGGTRA